MTDPHAIAPSVAKPCPECAFLKTCPPGLLGGSPVETYVGQIVGPFAIPCHMQCSFDDPEWKQKGFDTRQCAGAAHFRANLGLDKFLPPQLCPLPISIHVFQTMEAFVAHHKEITIEAAAAELQAKPPAAHLRDQLVRHDNMIRTLRR